MKEKVIVFGGSGFLGSYVADMLLHRGYRIVIFDLLPYKRLKIGQGMVVGDINDKEKVKEVMKDASIIYNFAAVADIDEATLDPLKTLTVNVLGNFNLMNIAKDFNIKRYIFASSIYVYGKAGSFYKSSKYAAELFIKSFNETYGLNYTILRYGSLYGRYANDSNTIRRMLKSALMTKEIRRYGDGEEIREYINVIDAAGCSVDILNNRYKNKCLVISGNQPLRIKDLLVMIKEIMGGKIKIKYLPAKTTHHYVITPYSFMSQMAEKIVSTHYIDLGQGILDCLNELHFERRKNESTGN